MSALSGGSKSERHSNLKLISWGCALSTHSGRGSRVLPSAWPLRVTTLLLSLSRWWWMSSETTRGQSSWLSPLDSTHTSTWMETWTVSKTWTANFRQIYLFNTHTSYILVFFMVFLLQAYSAGMKSILCKYSLPFELVTSLSFNFLIGISCYVCYKIVDN